MATAICRPWGQELLFRLQFLSLSILSLYFLCSLCLFLHLLLSFSSFLCSSARSLSISHSVFLSIHLCFPFSLPCSSLMLSFLLIFFSISFFHPFFLFSSVGKTMSEHLSIWLSLSAANWNPNLSRGTFSSFVLQATEEAEEEQALTAGGVNP